MVFLVHFTYLRRLHRVIDLHLSLGDVHPNKQRHGPRRRLSHHKDLLILDAIVSAAPSLFADQMTSYHSDNLLLVVIANMRSGQLTQKVLCTVDFRMVVQMAMVNYKINRNWQTA